MKAKVIENICIGCGACQALVPDMFEINDNGVAHAIKTVVPEDLEEQALEAKDNCPTNAIDIDETEE